MSDQSAPAANSNAFAPPTLSLPKGGGAIRGMGEKFAANPVTGTGSLTVPIATSPGRSGFGPQLALSYDSGAGNGPFGLGWNLSLPAITRKTDKGLPQYRDAEESDVFILSGAEDLVPVYREDPDGSWVTSHVGYHQNPNEFWVRDNKEHLVIHEDERDGYRVRRYCPRIEGLFARIERWTSTTTGEIHWRSISKDNITTLYGKDNKSRVFDPAEVNLATPAATAPTRIFSWLICESYDDKGNAIVYDYVEENEDKVDLAQANERNRVRTANRYLKHIKYGNRVSRLVQPDLAAADWMFEVLFDYDEAHIVAVDLDPARPAAEQHRFVRASTAAGQPWSPRLDPFSSYRAGFEVRTYRLCQRVLMFHHFPGEADVGEECLVRSTDFTYGYEVESQAAANPVYSKLLSVTQNGYKRNGDEYISKSLPPLEFTYSEARLQSEVHSVDPASLENLPIGLDGAAYQWTDLHGEGIPGILTEQAGAWFYKRNLSPINIQGSNGQTHLEAKFAPVELVALKPNLALGNGAQFMDLAGDGQPDLVVMDGPLPGFYEHDLAEGWNAFRPFTARLNRDTRDPNLKFVDLDGDGHADVLITEDQAFVWHPSLGEAGFGPARRVQQTLDEEKGPRLVFADGEQAIYLADLSGDGLTDLVRIRNGAVCYWPNLGYGRFGAKVTMDNAPYFDMFGQFNQQRIRLADIDGSGTTDIIYLHGKGVRIYFNQSGNRWSAAQTIPFPAIDNLAAVQAVDLLADGTACLVWSSPLPGAVRRPMHYVKLMGEEKPHLLVKTVNNLGAETVVQYAPSTRFYLADKVAGKPWITKLPFPVHVVEKVTVTDTWRKTSFATTYRYHHGYFDGHEREFRGFGRVEQVDVESYGHFAAGNSDSPYITDDLTLYQPPVKTVTWYHTGAFLNRAKILSHYQEEYFPTWFEALQPGEQVLGDFKENDLPEPDLAQLDLNNDEWREALRACKGMMLRQEIYELDVDALAQGEEMPVKLFSAAWHNCHIQRLQPQASNPHAVFLVTESEAITYHYELDLRQAAAKPDPRIAHTLNLSIDKYGNVQQAVSVVYPRLNKDGDATLNQDTRDLIAHVQGQLHLAYSETHYTKDAIGDDHHRLRLPCEVMTYELTGELLGVQTPAQNHGEPPALIADRYFTLDELRAYKLSEKYQTEAMAIEPLLYHQLPDNTTPQKRLVEHVRTLFFKETLDAPEGLGMLNHLALPYETYTLALTTDLLNPIFGDKLTPNVQAQLADKGKSGYLSGIALTDRFGAEAAGQYWICSGVAGFNADAPHHFYLPERYTDPFGNQTTLNYDRRDLFIQSSEDALGNRTEVTAFDFRVLAPRELQDINNNRTEVRFDALGLPTVMAVKGKGAEGDDFAGFDDAALNPPLTTMIDFFVTNDYSSAAAQALLGRASARHLYYFGETIQDGKPVWGVHPPCAAGIVREQHVAQRLDSPVQTVFEYADGTGNVLVKKVQAEPEQPGGPLRWVASGKTILNNKGKPVKQYEPSFSQPVIGHRFDEEEAAHADGVTSVIYYDAVGRVIRTEAPDGSYSRVEFSPWQVSTYDANDTVGEPNNAWFARMSTSLKPDEQRAARSALHHADTPATTILDSLGREVISIAYNRVNGVDEKYVTFSKLDAEGKPLWIQDARGNRVMQYITPPLPEGQHPFNDAQNLNPQGFAPCYDIAGNLLFQHSMDAGDRWMINDAAGKPMVAWNSRGFITWVEYDALHRPTALIVTDGAGNTFAAERTVYGETAFGAVKSDPAARERAQTTNHLGQPYQIYDGAGVVTNMRYDFKGNLLESQRTLLRDHKTPVNWPVLTAPPQPLPHLLENEHFVSRSRYDALNRPQQISAPHSSSANPLRINVTQPSYNAAGLLERVDLWLNYAAEPDGLLATATADQPMVQNIDYNAKGQRILIAYGNGATTTYDYDKETFRLTKLKTTRPNRAAGVLSVLFAEATVVQDLSYTYDPVGNITRIADASHKSFLQSGQEVEAAGDYSYDALYRLTAASGREHSGQMGFLFNPPDGNDRDYPFVGHRIHANDLQGLASYVERYEYDAVGNILAMAHHDGSTIDQPGEVRWRRHYQYALDSNQLLATSAPGDPDDLPHYVAAPGYSQRYSYDLHGNMTQMPHLPLMAWDFKDQLHASSQQVRADGGTPETTYYFYDAGGQRVRKVTERQAAPGATPRRKAERIYLGGFEIYREYNGDGATVTLERETLHIMDDEQRIALVETQTVPSMGQPLIRYQFGNHLGSASLELDEQAQIISYEEYAPYGSSTYQAARSQTERPKRYRYTGKERDEESGLYYHGARYYAPWLGKWISVDPKGIAAGINIFTYCLCNPVVLFDPNGRSPMPGVQPVPIGPPPPPWMTPPPSTPSTLTPPPVTTPTPPISTAPSPGPTTAPRTGFLPPVAVGVLVFIAIMLTPSNTATNYRVTYTDPDTSQTLTFRSHDELDGFLSRRSAERRIAPGAHDPSSSRIAPGSQDSGEVRQDPAPADLSPKIAPPPAGQSGTVQLPGRRDPSEGPVQANGSTDAPLTTSPALEATLKDENALTILANRIKGMGQMEGATVEIALARMKDGRRIFVAGLNSSARWSQTQLDELKRLGINVAPQQATDMGKKEGGAPHAEENIAGYLQEHRAKGERWSRAVVGKRGSYVCNACESIVRSVGGVVEPGFRGKSY
ncbi:MAG: SpvB/TcaC N-terminal domain-containing protein [Caldilineaceae bacterium]